MKFWPLILGTTLLAGSGCVHYRPQPLAPEKSANQLESRRLDDAGLKAFISTNSSPAPEVWPLEKWDLDSLTLAAFYFHPSLEVARAQWQLAEAGVKTAGGRPNPTLTVTPQYNTTTFVPSPWGPSVSVDLPIETAGKRGKRIAHDGGEKRHAHRIGRDRGKAAIHRDRLCRKASHGIAHTRHSEDGAERRQHLRQQRSPADHIHQAPAFLQRRDHVLSKANARYQNGNDRAQCEGNQGGLSGIEQWFAPDDDGLQRE